MKKFITTISVYEIVMILILSSEKSCNKIICMFSRYSYCDFCEYSGFQYLVMCLLIPAIIALIWWWKDEIRSRIKHIEQKSKDNKRKSYNKMLEDEFEKSKEA